MRRTRCLRLAVCIATVLLIAAAAAGGDPGKGDKSIFDLLMPGQEPRSSYNWPDPPPQLKAFIDSLVKNVQNVELRIYRLKAVSESDALKGFDSVLTQQGWSKRATTM